MAAMTTLEETISAVCALPRDFRNQNRPMIDLVAATGYLESSNGFSHFNTGNRAKSPSLVKSVARCSMA